MINIDNLKVLAQTWMPDDQQHVEFLNKKHPTLYQKLVDLVNTKQIVLDGLQINGKPAFRNCCSNVRLCLIQQKKYYHCFDCSFAQMAALCRKCFNLEKHRNHNWVYKEMKGKPYCQCGMTYKICPEVMCKSHNSINRIQNPMNQQERHIFLAFFTLYSKIIVNSLSSKANFSYLYERYTDYLKQLCRYSIDYIELTAQIMSTQYSKARQKTILVEIIQKNKLNDNIFKLLTYLCNYTPFQYTLSQCLFTASFPSRYDPHLKFYFKICDNPAVMNRLAENKIIIYNQDKNQSYNYSRIIEYYCEILQQYKWKNKRGILIPVWKYLKNELNLIKNLINSPNMELNSSKQKQLFMILQDCIPDFSFFQQLIAFVVVEWKYTQYQGYFSHSLFYNHLALVALKAVQANISDVWIVFDKCDKQLLSKFLSFYFGQIFTDRKKCKFNSLTAKCFISIINKFNLDCLNYVKLSQNIPILKIGRILSIVLRNLTAYKHVQDLQILKIAQMSGNTEIVHQKQQRIFEWFQQYFFIKTQINQNLIVAYKNRGILQISKIKQFLIKKSLFSKSSKIFTYQGSQIDVHPDLLLQFLDSGEEVYGIRDAGDPDMFYTQSRLQVVTFIFEQAVQKVDFSNFQSHNKKDRYMICSTAVILNKMTKSQNPIFQKYVQKLKQLSEKMWRSNNSVDRLFQIRMYKPKQKMQENDKPNQNKNQIKLQQMESMIVLQPTIMQQKEMKIGEQKKQEQTKQEQQKQQAKVEVEVQEEKVEVEVQEAKVEVEVKKQEQKQVQKIKQKSQQELLKQERKKKINKIAQKYSASSKKYLAFSVNQQHEKQVCLVCRQTLSDYGLLSYYGFLQKKTKGIIWKKYSSNKVKTCHFTMDSCFHAIHQKCCGNNNRKCILCTSPYDCFIPVVTKQLDQSDQCVMTRMWWEEQFTQLIYKKFGKMSDFEVYISMFQSLVISISTMYLLPHKTSKTPHTKTQKWLYLLTHLYKIQTEQSKKQIHRQLKILLKQSEQVTDFINIIRIITSLAMLNKILAEQLILQTIQIEIEIPINLTIQKLIDKAKLMFQIGYCRETFRHVEIILGEKIGDLGFLDDVDIQVLWRELNLLGGFPETVKQLMNKRQVCKNCKLIENYYCLGCDKVMCKNCVKLSAHIQQGCACIELQHANLHYFDSSTNKQESAALYFNCFKQKYDQTAMDLDQYYIDTSIVNKIIEKILS